MGSIPTPLILSRTSSMSLDANTTAIDVHFLGAAFRCLLPRHSCCVKGISRMSKEDLRIV